MLIKTYLILKTSGDKWKRNNIYKTSHSSWIIQEYKYIPPKYDSGAD